MFDFASGSRNLNADVFSPKGWQPSAQGKGAKPRRPGSRHASIPHVSLVPFDLMFPQQFAKLILERAAPVMLFLISMYARTAATFDGLTENDPYPFCQ